MRPTNQSIHIIGWGDVQAESRYAVSNDQVLEKIRTRLREYLDRLQSDDAYCALQASLENTESEKLVETVQAELSKLTNRTSQEVTDKIGVVSRQWMTDRNSTRLALIAAEQAIAIAGHNDPCFDRKKIGIIGSGGSTPDDLYPGCSAKLQHLLKVPYAEGCDYSLACCSGTQAFIGVCRAMLAEKYLYGLVAIGETVGSRANACLNEDATIWGDGGGAVALKLVEEKSTYGVIAYASRIDGSRSYTTKSRGIGVSPEHQRYDYVDASMEGHGREIFRWVRSLSDPLTWFMYENHIDPGSDRVFFLPHNGNVKMIVPLGVNVGIPEEQILHQIANRGNQSSASVFSTLAYYADQIEFRTDDVLVFATFGGGLAYNFLAYRWP